MRARGFTRLARKIVIVLDVVVLAAVALAGALVGGLWAYSKTTPGQARLGHLVERAVHGTVPGVQLRGLGMTGGRDIVLRDVNLFDPQGVRAVHVDSLTIHPRWTALLHGQLDIEQVRVDGLAVDARTLPDGRLNLTALVPPRPDSAPKTTTTRTAAPPWTVRRIEVVNSRAELHQPDGVVTVSGLTLTASASAAGGTTTLGLDELRADLQLPGRPLARVALAGNATSKDQVIAATVGELRVAGLLAGNDVIIHASVRKEGDRLASSGTAVAGTAGSASWSAAVALGAQGLGAYDVVAQVDQLALQRLPVDLPAGHLSARLSAKGTGVPLQAGTSAAATLTVQDSAVAGYRIQDATVRASTEGPTWTLHECATHVAGVTVHASGSGRGAGGKAHLALDVDRPHAHGAALAPNLPITGKGHLTASVEGRWPGQLRFQLQGDVRQLAVARTLSVATARLNVDGTAVQRGRVSDGGLRPAALARGGSKGPFEGPSTGEWSVTAHGKADVTRLVHPALSASDAGLTFSVRGPLSAPSGSVSAHARQLVLPAAELRLDSAGLDARGNGGDITLTARAHGADGDVDIQADVRRRRDTLDVALARLGLDLHHKALRQKVMLANAASFHLQTADEELKITGLHLLTQGSLANGELLLEGTVNGAGRAHRAPGGHLVLGLRNASAASVPALDADVTLDVADARARAALDVKQTKGTARVTGKVDVPLARTSTTLGWKLATTGPLQMNLDSQEVELASIAPLQHILARWGLTGGNFHIQAAASGDMRDPQATLAMDVRHLEYRDVTGDGRDSHIHRVPGIGVGLSIATAPKRLRTSTKLFLYDGGFATVNVDLGIGLSALLAGADVSQAPLDATVDIPRFQIAAFRSVSDQLQDTSGWLTGHGRLTGTAAHPRGAVDVTLADGRLDQLRLGLLAAHAESDGHQLHATLRLPTEGAHPGLLQAQANVTLGPAPRLDATIDMKAVDPGFVRPLVPGLRELSGVIDAKIVAAGRWPKPAFTGQIYYYGGRLGVVGEPTFTDLGLAIALSPGKVEVKSLQAFSGGGSLGGKGMVTLDGLQVTSANVSAHAHRFVLAAAGISGSRLDGDLTMTMGRTDNTLNGEAHIPTATVWLPGLSVNNKHPQRITPHDDVHFTDGASRAAQQRDAAAAKAPPTRLNLKARGDTIFVRAKDLDIEAETRLSLRTTPSGEDALFGTIHIRRGHINISDQPFQLDDGRVTFDGSGPPRLDLHLQHTYTDATVTVDLRGTPAKPELHFRSDPPSTTNPRSSA